MTMPEMKSIKDIFPIIIEKYERFIPNIEGMGIPDKINAIIQYLNRIGKINNDVVTNWNVVMKWVLDDGLQETTNAKIDELIANGTFEELLNGMFTTINDDVTIFKNDVNTQIKDIAVNVKDKLFGAKGDGVTNDATAIQAALDYAYTNGIRTVLVPYTPTGYVLNGRLNIPKGVLLLGNGSPSAGYFSGGTNGSGMFSKSYFIMDGITGTPSTGTQAITLTDNSGIERFGFYYKTVNTNLTTGDVPIFPWTIYASGFGLHLKDLTSMGASHFISVGAFERGYIEGVSGLVTKMGFRIRRSRDISRISKVHFNPNLVFPLKDGVATTENFSTYFTDLMKRDLIAFRFGSADIFQMTDILSIFTNKAIEVVPINYSDGLGEDFDNYAFCLTGKDLAFDNTKYGLYVQRDLSFTAKITNLDIIPITTDNTAVGITMTGGASGLLTIANLGLKGTTGQTLKHIVLDSTGVSMVDISGSRMIGIGTPTDRSQFADLFTVTGNNRLNAEILFSKTNSGGVYKTVYYSSDAVQYPNGVQVKNFSLEETATGIEFQIVRRDGGDVKTPVFGVDNVGGISGGFAQNINAGATSTYDLRGSNNANGRGKFIVIADFNGNAYLEGYSVGGSIVSTVTGTLASTTQNNANTLNVFMASAGILSIQNNLGSNRNVSVVFFPASR